MCQLYEFITFKLRNPLKSRVFPDPKKPLFDLILYFTVYDRLGKGRLDNYYREMNFRSMSHSLIISLRDLLRRKEVLWACRQSVAQTIAANQVSFLKDIEYRHYFIYRFQLCCYIINYCSKVEI